MWERPLEAITTRPQANGGGESAQTDSPRSTAPDRQLLSACSEPLTAQRYSWPDRGLQAIGSNHTSRDAPVSGGRHGVYADGAHRFPGLCATPRLRVSYLALGTFGRLFGRQEGANAYA